MWSNPRGGTLTLWAWADTAHRSSGVSPASGRKIHEPFRPGREAQQGKSLLWPDVLQLRSGASGVIR